MYENSKASELELMGTIEMSDTLMMFIGCYSDLYNNGKKKKLEIVQTFYYLVVLSASIKYGANKKDSFDDLTKLIVTHQLYYKYCEFKPIN